MFPIEYPCCTIDQAESDAIIASGQYRTWMCQDWRCPKHGHCAKHFGLSKRYAEMGDQPANEALVTPSRTEGGCRYYQRATRDYVSESLGQRPSFPVAIGDERHD